jgi:superoxide dismutase, Fe-Mn family
MSKHISRRHFLQASAKTTAAISLTALVSSDTLAGCTSPKVLSSSAPLIGFDQQPLPYAYNALETAIDALTMEIHYSKHAAAYSKNAKDAAAAENADVTKPIETVLTSVSKYSAKMRNNAGGHYNHELFWKCMKQNGGGLPTGKLLASINQSFGNTDTFKTQFADAGKNRFGSGWAWLYADKDKQLRIGSTPNQDNPLMDISDIKGTPLLGLDVWEHAYYLRYQNKRADYINAWWNVVNWEFVQQRFESL